MENLKNKRGFTLLEIIITLVVSSAIFAGTLPLIFNAITSNKAARLKLNAYESAQKELENVKGANFSTLNNYNFTVQGVPGATGTIIVNRTVDGQAQTTIADVKALITWTFNNRNETVQLETYVYGG